MVKPLGGHDLIPCLAFLLPRLFKILEIFGNGIVIKRSMFPAQSRGTNVPLPTSKPHGSIQNSTQNYTTSGGARPHASLWAVLNYNDNRSPRWKQPSNFNSSWSFWNVIWFLYRAPFFACFFFLRSEKNVEWFESSCTVKCVLRISCQMPRDPDRFATTLRECRWK